MPVLFGSFFRPQSQSFNNLIYFAQANLRSVMILNHRIVVDPEIIISEFAEQDKQSLVEYLNDREIFENTFNIPRPYTTAHADWWIKRKLEQNKEFGQPVSFAIRNSEDKLIGAAGFDGLVLGSSHSAELGYWLAKPFRGQGIMSAVVQKLCLYDRFLTKQ